MIHYIRMDTLLYSSVSSIMSNLEIHQTFCRKGPQSHPNLIVRTLVVSSPALPMTVLFLVSHCCLWGCPLEAYRAPSFLRTHSSRWAMPWTPLQRPCSEEQAREEGDGGGAGTEVEWAVKSEWQGSCVAEL